MSAVPIWVQVLLSGMRWGVVCGVVTGWIFATAALVDIDGFTGSPSERVGLAVGIFIVAMIYGSIPGAILGSGLGLIVGAFSGLALQLMLSRTKRSCAVAVTFGAVIGVQVVGVTALTFVEFGAIMYLVIPAIAAVPLLRTLRRVAAEWASPEVSEHRRDTFAA